MLRKNIFAFFMLISVIAYSQTFQPGIALAWLPDLNISGCKISNHFILPCGSISLDFGVDFILGRGKPNIDYAGNMQYNIELAKFYSPHFLGLTMHTYDFCFQEDLKPLTTSTSQLNLSCGIVRSLYFRTFCFSFTLGGYVSQTSSHFLIGPFSEADVDFYVVTNDGNYTPVYLVDSTKWDVLFPVNLRYLNLGAYLGAEWLLMKDKRVPVGIEMKYFAGLKGKHIATFGINFHLPVKAQNES